MIQICRSIIKLIELIELIELRGVTINSMKRARDIMVKEVYTINGNAKVALARLKMLRYSIGALPVVQKNGKLIGIITLRDIELAGRDISSIQVQDLMSKDLITCAEDTSIKEIVDTMIKTGIQRIPVVRNGKLVGLITQTSIIKAAREFLE